MVSPPRHTGGRTHHNRRHPHPLPPAWVLSPVLLLCSAFSSAVCGVPGTQGEITSVASHAISLPSHIQAARTEGHLQDPPFIKGHVKPGLYPQERFSTEGNVQKPLRQQGLSSTTLNVEQFSHPQNPSYNNVNVERSSRPQNPSYNNANVEQLTLQKDPSQIKGNVEQRSPLADIDLIRIMESRQILYRSPWTRKRLVESAERLDHEAEKAGLNLLRMEWGERLERAEQPREPLERARNTELPSAGNRFRSATVTKTVRTHSTWNEVAKEGRSSKPRLTHGSRPEGVAGKDSEGSGAVRKADLKTIAVPDSERGRTRKTGTGDDQWAARVVTAGKSELSQVMAKGPERGQAPKPNRSGRTRFPHASADAGSKLLWQDSPESRAPLLAEQGDSRMRFSPDGSEEGASLREKRLLGARPQRGTMHTASSLRQVRRKRGHSKRSLTRSPRPTSCPEMGTDGAESRSKLSRSSDQSLAWRVVRARAATRPKTGHSQNRSVASTRLEQHAGAERQALAVVRNTTSTPRLQGSRTGSGGSSHGRQVISGRTRSDAPVSGRVKDRLIGRISWRQRRPSNVRNQSRSKVSLDQSSLTFPKIMAIVVFATAVVIVGVIFVFFRDTDNRSRV